MADEQPAVGAMPEGAYRGVGPDPHGRYRTGAVWGWILGALVVLGGAYVGAQWFLSDRVPAGAVVAGVEIGGLSREAAVDALNTSLDAVSRQPITLRAGGAATTLDPVVAGVRLEAEASVDQLTHFSLNPARLLTHIQGDYGELAPIISYYDPEFIGPAEQAATALGTKPADGSVFFTDGRAAKTDAQYGQAVGVDDIRHAITVQWLRPSTSVEVEAAPVEPRVTQAATDAAYAQAQRIASAPVNVQVDGQTYLMSVADLTDAVYFRVRGGEIVPEFNSDLLAPLVYANTENLTREPQNARFVFEDGRPAVVGGQPGTTLNVTEVGPAIHAAALAEGVDRIANLHLIEEPPELTREYLESLGVNEVVSTFGTTLTANTTRTNNLRRGAELITGVLVLPGEIFSLTDAISPINALNGFGYAGVIVAGNFTEGMGGGLSQLATTAYNAGFFAGFEDIEHRPHSLFISRYPAGREATLVTGSLDMRFRNNTPYGALIQSWVAGNQIHVSIWSTPYFRVETQASARTNSRPAGMVYSSSPNCQPQSPGPAGFTITNFRQVFRLSDGEEVINEANTWTYQPTNGFRCVSE